MKKFSFPLMLLLMTSCGGHLVKEFTDIPMLVWERDNVLSFPVDIPDDKQKYEMTFALRHSSLYPYSTIKIRFKITLPNKEIYEVVKSFELREEGGMWKAGCMGDLCDVEFPTDITFDTPGYHTVLLSHEMLPEDLALVFEAGIIVDAMEEVAE
ncbi:MAG: hypothetical protein IH946_04170 [Bacteroidetes bacterium]|nr:hypothetical protein [Bacteroidota bacterium]